MGIIEVIHATSRGVSLNSWRGVLSAVSPSEVEATNWPEKRPWRISAPITFSKVDLEGTSWLHDDALVVTSWIGGFLVKRVMVDQGSGAKIMTPICTRVWG